jgi:hypothetical protein
VAVWDQRAGDGDFGVLVERCGPAEYGVPANGHTDSNGYTCPNADQHDYADTDGHADADQYTYSYGYVYSATADRYPGATYCYPDQDATTGASGTRRYTYTDSACCHADT